MATHTNPFRSKSKHAVIANLAERVKASRVKNKDKVEFIPIDQLDRLVTKDEVQKVLKAASVRDAESLTQFVLEKPARKLFLILIILSTDTEKVSLLIDLKRSEITDASLPIKFESAKKGR